MRLKPCATIHNSWSYTSLTDPNLSPGCAIVHPPHCLLILQLSTNLISSLFLRATLLHRISSLYIFQPPRNLDISLTPPSILFASVVQTLAQVIYSKHLKLLCHGEY